MVRWLVAVAAEDAEQEEEQVDEVEIERERAYGGELAHGSFGGDHCEALYLLGVPGGKSDEYEHAA